MDLLLGEFYLDKSKEIEVLVLFSIANYESLFMSFCDYCGYGISSKYTNELGSYCYGSYFDFNLQEKSVGVKRDSSDDDEEKEKKKSYELKDGKVKLVLLCNNCYDGDDESKKLVRNIFGRMENAMGFIRKQARLVNICSDISGDEIVEEDESMEEIS